LFVGHTVREGTVPPEADSEYWKSMILEQVRLLEEDLFSGHPVALIMDCSRTLEAALWSLLMSEGAEIPPLAGFGKLIGCASQRRVFDRPCYSIDFSGKLNSLNKVRNKGGAHIGEKPTLEMAREASDITRLFLLESGLVQQQDLVRCRNLAIQARCDPPEDYLRLDRREQRGLISEQCDEIIEDKLHLMAVHGETLQGHHELSELALHEYEKAYPTAWATFDVEWPARGEKTNRMGELLDALWSTLNSKTGGAGDRSAHDMRLPELKDCIRQHLERTAIQVRHRLQIPRREDADLCREYYSQIWQELGSDLPNPVLLVLEIVHAKPGGFWWFSAANREARSQRASAARIIQAVESLGGKDVPELSSVTVDDLAAYYRKRSVKDPQDKARQCHDNSEYGRFEIVIKVLDRFA